MSRNQILLYGESDRGVVANVLDILIDVSEFELQSSYNVHFWTNTLEKDMNLLILKLNSTTNILLQEWLWHKITHEVWYAIKQRNQPNFIVGADFILLNVKQLPSIKTSRFNAWQNMLCWGFKGVQEVIPSEEASTLQIGSVAFPLGQCTNSQLHPCHRLFDQDGHQHSFLPSLQSRPCSLWLLLIP